jgi:hypothetical protein
VGKDTGSSDMQLFRRAVRERWPMSDETRERWMEKLAFCIEHGDTREAISALKVAASMDAINQRDTLAEKYAIPVGEVGTSAIRPLHEEIAAMMQALPVLALPSEGVSPAHQCTAEHTDEGGTDTTTAQPDSFSCCPIALPSPSQTS